MAAQDTDLQAIQLGALLHDIGKLYQRADPQPPPEYDGLSKDDYGSHGAHAKWSAGFIERHVAKRWPIKAYDVLIHHQPIPQSRTAKIIALADRLAAGEREEEQASSITPWESQLLTIFSRLRDRYSQATEPRNGYYPLKPLELSRDTIFPRPDRSAPEVCRRGYSDLWRGFQTDFSQLDRDDYDRYLEAVYHLLQRYCWCVPSAAYHQLPDVSLFDHSRLTCAIATCLYLDRLDDSSLDGLLAWPPRGSDPSKPHFLLVSGDLSGLQSFLYTLSAEGAAKTLRGRSLYLQLLTESAARFLLNRLGLPPLNAIYWGGGHFYLLAPATCQDALDQACRDLDFAILELHGGDLGLAVGWSPISMEDFRREGFAGKWGEVGQKVGEAKQQRFKRVLASSYRQLFAPSGRGGRVGRCETCHNEIVDGGTQCQFCQGMEELGELVARAAIDGKAKLSVGASPPSTRPSRWQSALGRLGCWWDFGTGGEGAMRYTINTADFAPAGADGFRWIPALIPIEQGSEGWKIKDFDGIARDSIGIERLGVLRMDVDDLGSLFASGLGANATASRLASLSFALRLFFEGWINQAARDTEADRDMVPPGVKRRGGLLYGVYSGGDDLFIVGAWDRIPLLARRIKADLEDFAMGNRAVRISAGIALVDPHLPIYQAAEDAHKALEQGAKEHRRENGPPKDAVTLLGETCGWEELDPIRNQVAELAQLVASSAEAKLPRSPLSTLGALFQLYRREASRQAGALGIDRDRLYYGRWTWMAACWLGRARERAQNEAAKTALAALQKRLAEPRAILKLGLVSRWAEYLTRTREGDRG